MKVGVTGGAGYIGSTLVQNLVDNGHEVVSVDNETIGTYEYLRKKEATKKAILISGDIRNLKLLLKSWKDCTAVAHLAALPGLELCNKKPEEAVSVNIYGTYRVMEAAKTLGVKRVVFCSSASVYGKPCSLPVTEGHELHPLNLYGVTKLSGEKILDAFHVNHEMETVNLRFGNIYGVGIYTRYDTVIPKFVKQALSGKPLTIYGDGKSSRDFVHVKDITDAISLSLTTDSIGGETFNVGGETLSINNITEIIKEEVSDVTGRHVNTVNTPPREGETREFSYDLMHIRKRLGFENKLTVKEGVRQLINYCLEDQR